MRDVATEKSVRLTVAGVTLLVNEPACREQFGELEMDVAQRRKG